MHPTIVKSYQIKLANEKAVYPLKIKTHKPGPGEG